LRTNIGLNIKDPNGLIKGPLSFVAGDVRVVIFKNDESHSIQPCLYSGLKKNSDQSVSQNEVKAAFGQLKVKKIIPSIEESKAKDIIPSIKKENKKTLIP
jgi:hypothetical protein